MFEGATSFNSPLFSLGSADASTTFMFASDPSFNQPLDGWNTSGVTDMSFMFQNATAFNQPVDSWNVHRVSNMNGLFQFASSFDQPLNAWDTSSVRSIDYLFQQASAFNHPLDQWDTASVTSMTATFSGALSFNQALASWNTASVTSMNGLFANGSAFNQPLLTWQTGAVTDMAYMFLGASAFNQPMDGWNTAVVQKTDGMFELASAFNQPLSHWDMSAVTSMAAMFLGATSFDAPIFTSTPNVTDMSGMFQGASAFNHSLIHLDTHNVTSLSGMFAGATSFNSPLFSDVHNVTSMPYLFAGATSFNQPLAHWNTAQVTDMSYLFEYATSFNQPLAQWNTANVTTLDGAFSYTTTFNQPLGGWDVSHVSSLNYVFQGAVAFDQPLNAWHTSNVTTMSATFAAATAFNQPLSQWDTAAVTDMSFLFQGASAFAQNISGWRVAPGTDVTDRCQGVITCNQLATSFTLTGNPIGGFTNNYEVAMVIPRGQPAPTGTLVINDNGVPACSSTKWVDRGMSGLSGEEFVAHCSDTNGEAAGDLITATYVGGGDQNPTSAQNYGSDYGVSVVPSIVIAQITLYVVPDGQRINYADASPYYTFSYHLNSPSGPLLLTSVASEPSCQSDYDGTWNAGTYRTAITCSSGYDTNFVFDTTSTAALVIAPILLYVVPDAQGMTYGDAAPSYTYSFYTGSPAGSSASVTLETDPVCTSSYDATTNVPASPLTIHCAAGLDPNYVFDVTATAPLTISPVALVVVPDDLALTYGDVVSTYTFTYHLGSVSGPMVSVSPSVESHCSSPYTAHSSVALSPLTVSCSGGLDQNYVFDTSASAQVTIAQASPVVAIHSSPGSATFGTNYVVTYGLTVGDVGGVTLTSSNPSCAVSGLRVTFTSGTGGCVLTLSVDADVNYVATADTQTIRLGKALLSVAPNALHLNALDPTPTYVFSYHANTASGPVLTPIIEVAPTCSSLYSSTTSAARSPLTIRCVQGSDLNYQFDVSATSQLNIARNVAPALSVVAPSSGIAGTPLPLSAKGGSGTTPVSYSVTGAGCSLAGTSLTATGSVHCAITALNAQTDYYQATSSPVFTIHFNWAVQAPLILASPLSGVAGTPIRLTATGGSGTRSLSFAVQGPSCYLAGTTLTATTGTTCTVVATNAANTIYASASTTPATVVFSLAPQAPVLMTSPTVGVVGSPLTLSATGGLGVRSFHYQVTGAGCSVKAGLLSTTHTGTCVVTAINLANGIYALGRALPVTVTFATPHAQSLYVLFSPGSSTLTAADQASLKRYAQALRTAKVTAVTATGYVNEGNTLLATQRAQSTAAFLSATLKGAAGSAVSVAVTTSPAQLKWAFGLNAVYVSN